MKRLILGAAGLALVGAAAIPVGGASAVLSPQKAAKCAVLDAQIASYTATLTTATEPVQIAILTRFKTRAENQETKLGCP